MHNIGSFGADESLLACEVEGMEALEDYTF
jgi:hypothetical protein